MFNCQKVSELVSQSMDKDLPLYQRFGIRVHLLMCTLCSRNRKQLLGLRETLRSFQELRSDGDAPSPMPPETKKSLEKTINKSLHK